MPVVEQHVMMGTEQDGMIDVGKPLVKPILDVVGFGPCWWLVAAGPAASAVAYGEGAALLSVEQSLVSSNVERLSGLGEEDAEVASVAEVTFDRLH